TGPMHEVNRLLLQASGRLERAGLERPLFEAQLLLALALGRTRLEVLSHFLPPVTDEQRRRYDELVGQRERRVPLAYLRGTQEFFGLEFEVSPAVLVPRPETELLVEYAVAEMRGRAGATVVDVGTGSGCIAVAVASQLPDARVVGVD